MHILPLHIHSEDFMGSKPRVREGQEREGRTPGHRWVHRHGPYNVSTPVSRTVRSVSYILTNSHPPQHDCRITLCFPEVLFLPRRLRALKVKRFCLFLGEGRRISWQTFKVDR